ncbi:MAG: hypothetical protein HYY84_15695 [Deltaproteobacteria bacterium]|nr:hypothetical protein [Deltaproteobacteria bacterium]
MKSGIRLVVAAATVGVSANAWAHGTFTTPTPSYDVKSQFRQACNYGPGAKTTTTIGPKVPSGNALPFNHIIVLMMENRSFDHYYSALSKPEFYGNQIDVADDTFSNPDPTTGARVNRYRESRYCIKDTPHNWDPVHDSWNQGAMDGFLKAANPNGARALGYYTDADLPFYYWLSNTFSISDRYFSSVLGPTWPNRWFVYGATAWGRTKTPDEPVAGDELRRSPHIVKRMRDSGRTVKFYRDGAIMWPTAGFADLTMNGVPASQFASDVANDRLANLTYIDPNFMLSPHGLPSNALDSDEHPPANIQKGQAFIRGIVATLMSTPKVWKKTVLFITYDEHGGLYDHVAPPPACDPRGPNSSGKSFDRYGVRIPLIVVSPFAKKHYVSHRVTDHASIVRFIENRFGLGALTKRDANAWPLLDMFDFKNPPHLTPPALPASPIDPAQEKWCRENDPGVGAASTTPPVTTCSEKDREPNGSMRQAIELPALKSYPRVDQTLKGTLRGNIDMDVFRFDGTQVPLHQPIPTATIKTAGVDYCMFVVCKKGVTQLVGCPAGTRVKGAFVGMGKGCCRDKPGQLSVNFNCVGTTDESATVFMRLEQTENRCTDYEVTYRF